MAEIVIQKILSESYKVGYRVFQYIDFKGIINNTIIEWEWKKKSPLLNLEKNMDLS